MRIASCKTALFSLFFSLFLFFLCVPSFAAYENTYVNTGNQRADMIGIAETQLGYFEGTNGYTKYGAAFNNSYGDWCAYFVSWCAKEANISETILRRQGGASPYAGYFNIPYYTGTSYTPQPGDLFFVPYTKSNGSIGFEHVGLVYYTSGNKFYTIEGNYNNKVCTVERTINQYYFGVPNYENTATPPSTEPPAAPIVSASDCYVGEESVISWNPVANASSYYLYIRDKSTDKEYYSGNVGNTNSFSIALPEGIYYTYVSSCNTIGVSSTYAEFKVINNSVLPVAPSPHVSDCYIGETTTISWAHTLNAATYFIYIKSKTTDACFFSDNIGNTNSLSIELPEGLYYCYVSSCNGAGVSSTYAEFKVINNSILPVAPSPHVSDCYIGETTTISWEHTLNAATYFIYIRNKETEAEYYSNNIGKKNHLSISLPEGLYYSYVSSCNGAGISSTYIEFRVVGSPSMIGIRLSASATTIKTGENIEFTFTFNDATNYYYGIGNGSTVLMEAVIETNTFTYAFTLPGTYYIWGTARNEVGNTHVETINVTVNPNAYVVMYDVCGGENAPEGQTKVHDEALTLTEVIPTYMHHAFSGWATSPDGEVVYLPGATYLGNADITLYAVWKALPYTETIATVYSGYTLCRVSLQNMPQNCVFMVAGYKEGRMVFYEKRNVTTTAEDFAVLGNADTVRVFVLNNLTERMPVTKNETILLQN